MHVWSAARARAVSVGVFVLVVMTAFTISVPLTAARFSATAASTDSTFRVAPVFKVKIAQLKDGFSAQSSTWTRWGTDITTDSAGLALRATSAYDYLLSAKSYDLSASAVQVKASPSTTAADDETFFAVGSTTDGVYGQSGAYAPGVDYQILYSHGTIFFRQRIDGVTSDTTAAYSAVNQAWWRISESGGTVRWETSANGTTWTTRRTATVTKDITSMYVRFTAGNYVAGGGGTSHFSNLNT